MQSIDIFLIVLIIVFVLIYVSRMYETYVNMGIPTNDNITAKITTDMNYNHAKISTLPYYVNNLDSPPEDVSDKINYLQKFNKERDGQNDDFTEEFTTMNPFMGPRE